MYLLQSQSRGCEYRPPEPHLITDERECCKYCSLLKASHVPLTESKQRVRIQTSWAPSHHRWTWMLQALFTSKSITCTSYRVKAQGANTDLLSVILSPMTVKNGSLIVHLFSMDILFPDPNEHSPWWRSIFCGSVDILYYFHWNIGTKEKK